MLRRFAPVAATLALAAGALAPSSAVSAGGMGIPSSGSIGTTGYFLSCRSTSSTSSSTPYYDRANVLRTWDCGSGKRPHKGVDILGSSTAAGVNPVYAAAAGTVWTAERANGLGWRVVLRHGRDVGGNGRWTYTIYGHMGDCSSGSSHFAAGIANGASVAAGQLLGYQGDDSYPNGCAGRVHLHWEVRASDSDVSNVFLATPASPNFYTGVQLTADDPNKASSVTASGPAPTSTPTPTPSPSPSPTPAPTASPTPTTQPTATPRRSPRFRPRYTEPPRRPGPSPSRPPPRIPHPGYAGGR